jgi:hypothetical protein
MNKYEWCLLLLVFCLVELELSSAASVGLLGHGGTGTFRNHSRGRILHVLVTHNACGELRLGFFETGPCAAIQAMHLFFMF